MSTEITPDAILELKGISMSFPGVKALNDVSIAFLPGEVHALVGENGAGKSTMMKILSGVYQATEGSLVFKGEPVLFKNPQQAQTAGISIIFQEFSLIKNFTVIENVFLNREHTHPLGFLDRKKERQVALDLLKEIGFELDVDARIEDLTVVQQQVVEIVKALSVTASVLIMDEPSAVLTDKELKRLFEIIRTLKNRGVTVIYISHMLEEVFEIADRVTVMKDGQVVGTKNTCDTDKPNLIRMMVGREITAYYPERTSTRGKKLLEVKNLTKKKALENIAFDLHEGEVLGIAGLADSGRNTMVHCILGIDSADSCDLQVEGKPAAMRSIHDAIAGRIGFISEDRKNFGIFGPMTVKDNITIVDLHSFLRLGFIRRKKEKTATTDQILQLRIKVSNMFQRADTLSGGNQQKMLLSRWLLKRPRIFIICEPTRGIDVGAKMEIYRIMRDLVSAGNGIIMISSELPEVIGVSDRIMVMKSGRVAGIIDQASERASEEQIMSMAVGHRFSITEEEK